MLELPESIAISKQINQVFAGKAVRDVQVNASAHKFAFFYEDPAAYPALLTGRKLDQALSFGGYVVLYFGNVHAAFGDGVQIRYYAQRHQVLAKHQLLIEFDDQSCLVCSVQMYGAMFVFEQGQMHNPYYNVALQKPSPLSESFDEQYFQSLVSAVSKKLSLKAFLAAEQRIPGLGNGVLQDILFQAKLHPKQKLANLTSEQIKQLFHALKLVLQQMMEQGGRNTEKDLFGKPGQYQTILSSKTWQQPCPVCQGTLQKEAYLGGSIYDCPNCQPLT